MACIILKVGAISRAMFSKPTGSAAASFVRDVQSPPKKAHCLPKYLVQSSLGFVLIVSISLELLRWEKRNKTYNETKV